MKNLIQFVLFLIALRKTTGDEKVIYAQVGQSVTLNIQQDPKDSYVNWNFGSSGGYSLASTNTMGGKFFGTEEVWKDKLSLSSNSLTITNIQEENFGDFFCKLSTSTRLVSWIRFSVVKVSVKMNPPSPVMPGDSITLNCETYRVPRKPKIYWISPQGKEKRWQEEVVMKAKSQDSGEWTCVVNEYKFTIPVSVADLSPHTHLYTSTNSTLKVSVSIKPVNYVQQIMDKIQKVEWDFFPKTSSSLSSQSLLYSSVEDQWREELDRRNLGFVNFTNEGVISLLINQTKIEDRGSYNCSMTLKNGYIMSSTVQVEVLQILASPGVEFISGQQLNLTCSIGHKLLSDMQVRWFPPRTSSLPMTVRPSEHLIIPKVSTGDSGTWRCELLQNGTRLTSAVITLKIDPILSVWMVVIICSAAVILILLLVVGFILCRRRQRRVRHIRHRLCQCKNPKPKGFYKT